MHVLPVCNGLQVCMPCCKSALVVPACSVVCTVCLWRWLIKSGEDICGPAVKWTTPTRLPDPGYWRPAASGGLVGESGVLTL